MKYLLAALLSLVLPGAMACECEFQSLRENYRKADLVLRVHVVSLQDTVQYDLYSRPLAPPFRYGAYATVRVQKVFKGRLPAAQLALAGTGSMCDFRFGKGGDYIIFLYKQDLDAGGRYVTSTCQRHFSVRDKAAWQAFRQARAAETRCQAAAPGHREALK